VLAANTAYADFPRLASIVARDRFLPRQFMNQGDRLAFSNGIVALSLLAGVLLGNAVEAYGAAHPILAGGHPARFVIALLGGIGLALAGATILGGTVLSDASPTVIGAAQALAAGAVLAVISVSIIPYAFSEVSSRVAVAAILGFIVGYLLS